jgi:hypothetical protein
MITIDNTTAQALGLEIISDFSTAREACVPMDRLANTRKCAEAFRERFLDQPVLPYYGSFDLLRIPYPKIYAYGGVFAQSIGLNSLIQILNRLFVIQYHDFNGVRRALLFSPSDYPESDTPYFKRVEAMLPEWAVRLVAPFYSTVEDRLNELGLSPADVDYISYDHLHTQNLKRWLSSGDQKALFPNAKLIVHAQEWASVQGLLPNQGDWYSRDGIRGVPDDRIMTFEQSLALGPGLAFMHTPGHTFGNHSLVARVPDGIRVTSENGVGSDSYAPLNSKRNAIRKFAIATGAEVVLNSNTLESSVDQYISMVQEATVAGPATNPEFFNVATSSEATANLLFPGSGSTHIFGPASFGALNH